MIQPQHPRTAETLLAHLRAGATSLVPSERRVAEVLVLHFTQLEHYSAASLATEAKSSAATVVRACQRLGFTGYQQLRTEAIRLSHARVSGTGPEKYPLTSASDDSAAAGQSGNGREMLLGQVFEAAHTELRTTEAMLDRVAFDRAVGVLCAAQSILFVGTGGSAFPAQDGALRFTMGGHTALAPTDVLGQQFTARMLKPQDVCVAVSFSGANRHTLEAVQAAQVAGAQVVAVTGSGLSRLARTADIVLATGSASNGSDVLFSRIAHMLVINALNLAVQQRAGVPSFGPSEQLAGLLSSVLQDPEDLGSGT